MSEETFFHYWPLLVGGAGAIGTLGWLWRTGRKIIRLLTALFLLADSQLNPEKNCIVKQLDARLESVELSVAEVHKRLDRIVVGQQEAAKIAKEQAQ